MTKDELNKLIRNEVLACVKQELPKIIKPMVQEAVAGALANILAEGIVKGPPSKPVGPSNRTVREGEQPKMSALARAVAIPEDPEAQRRMLRERFNQIEPSKMDILNETARQMQESGWQPGSEYSPDTTAQSILDNINPEDVAKIAANYSNIMDKLNLRK